jgi:hypothetical protein
MAEANPANPPASPSGQPNPPATPPANEDVTALKEQVKTLQSKLNDMGTFVEDASLLVAAIYKDPQLRTTVQQHLAGIAGGQPANQPPANQPPANNPPANQPAATPPENKPVVDPTVQSLDIRNREEIIGKVEAKYGYNKLDADKRKELRKTVEKRLNQWGSSVTTAPVHQLENLLEDAYLLSDMGKAKEEGRLEGLVQARENEMGALPTMGNNQPQPETTTLTPEQKEWAGKFGVAEDKVTSRLKEFQDTGVMTYKPKEEKPANNQPSPSGQPNPPAQPNAPQS